MYYSSIFRASCKFRDDDIHAVQLTKKKAKQALCSKVIRRFRLLDMYRGAGASESLSIGTHTPEATNIVINPLIARTDYSQFGNQDQIMTEVIFLNTLMVIVIILL